MRRAENALHGAAFAHFACAHHHHVVGDFAHQREVVADEQQAHGVRLPEPREQVQDLALHSDIEGGGRLVRDQELGLAGDRHRNHHPLLLPARKLMRVGAQSRGRIWNADFVEQLGGARECVPTRQREVSPQHLGNLVADGEHGVERAHRLLEHHRKIPAAQRPQVFHRLAQQIAALVFDAALRRDEGVLRQQPHDRQGGNALAGT